MLKNWMLTMYMYRYSNMLCYWAFTDYFTKTNIVTGRGRLLLVITMATINVFIAKLLLLSPNP